MIGHAFKTVVNLIAAGLVAANACAALANDAAPSKPVKPVKIKLDTLKPGKIKLDPRLGYVLVRVGPRESPKDNPISIGFRRIDEATNAALKFADGQGSFADFLRTSAVAVNTSRSFGDSNGAGIYLVGFYPGRWVINNVASTCLSMGTYAFDVKQGEIADIGTLLTAREDGKSSAPELKTAKLSDDLINFGTLMNMVMTHTMYVKPASDEPVLPAELAAMPRRRVELSADYRFANACIDIPNRAASLPAIGHQPPLTAEQAAAKIDEINPDNRVEDVAKRKAAKAAADAAKGK